MERGIQNGKIAYNCPRRDPRVCLSQFNHDPSTERGMGRMARGEQMKLTITITLRVPTRFTEETLQNLLDEIRDMIYSMLPDLEPVPHIPPVKIQVEEEK